MSIDPAQHSPPHPANRFAVAARFAEIITGHSPAHAASTHTWGYRGRQGVPEESVVEQVGSALAGSFQRLFVTPCGDFGVVATE